MTDSKYIVVDSPAFEFGPNLLIFPGHIGHATYARQLQVSTQNILSAGFIQFCEKTQKFVCFGESQSLGKSSNPEFDTCLLQTFLLNSSSRDRQTQRLEALA